MAGRILVVDDDFDIRELLTELLQDQGFQVESANNGQEALRQLDGASDAPALVLLDLMMPVMNGWELAEHLHESPRFAGVPVVLISADRDLSSHAQSLRAAGYLQKPVDLPELLKIVDRYCGAGAAVPGAR